MVAGPAGFRGGGGIGSMPSSSPIDTPTTCYLALLLIVADVVQMVGCALTGARCSCR